jgi:hypothetical protein
MKEKLEQRYPHTCELDYELVLYDGMGRLTIETGSYLQLRLIAAVFIQQHRKPRQPTIKNRGWEWNLPKGILEIHCITPAEPIDWDVLLDFVDDAALELFDVVYP